MPWERLEVLMAECADDLAEATEQCLVHWVVALKKRQASLWGIMARMPGERSGA